jgi:hypothetical protein
MMTPSRRALLGAALALPLAACATTTVTGAYRVGRDYSVTLGSSWASLPYQPRGLHLLTIDGPLLNSLYLTEGLSPGRFIVEPERRDRPTPTYRAGLSSRELVEFVADSVAALGYLDVETVSANPGKIGAADGIRFELAAKTARGLEIRGVGLIAERAGKAYTMFYLAPGEHYFEARLAEVESVFASATLAAS